MRIRQTIIAWTLLVGTAILGTVPSRQEAGHDSAEPNTAFNFNTAGADAESDDPFFRMEQQLIDSESLRGEPLIDLDPACPEFQRMQIWRENWNGDGPSHLTPYRIQGGVPPAPASSSI